ncbi:MAG: hypothetical protein M1840_005128 [Geoglossum simile]|nr:MAG: hypothetical protein M1840_005128 [Geoglossum simile]
MALLRMQQHGWGEVSCTDLAEDIALLNMLTREPGQPSENPLPITNQSIVRGNDQEPNNRELTLKYERDIVDSLSFVSATTSDPDKVMALCIEESHRSEGILIRVAANTGDLEQLKAGIQRMTNLLEMEATHSSRSRLPLPTRSLQPREKSVPSVENYRLLLQEVIGLNRDRIFCRLRSKHAPIHRKTGRVPGIPQLAGVVISRSGDYKWEMLKTQASMLQDYFKGLEDMEGDLARSPASHDRLACILETAHEISSSHDLTALMTSLPNTGKLGPDLKKFLPGLVQKLGRYIIATRRLLRYARKIRSFRAIQVETIRIDPLVPRPIRGDVDVSQSTSTTDRYLGTPRTTAQLRKRLGEFPSIQSTINTNLSQGYYKVHAEIQLLCFYSASPPAHRYLPRVICSSKNACFLCNLFVALDGRFHMAQTHGVLYPKWALPDFLSIRFTDGEQERLVAVVEQFSRAIRSRVRDALNLPDQKRLHPNESVLLIPPALTPSILSIAEHPIQEGPIVAILPSAQGATSDRWPPETPASLTMTSPLNDSTRRRSASTARTSVGESEHGGNSYRERGSVSRTVSPVSGLWRPGTGEAIGYGRLVGELEFGESIIYITKLAEILGNTRAGNPKQIPLPEHPPYSTTPIPKTTDPPVTPPSHVTPDASTSGSTHTLIPSAPQNPNNPNTLPNSGSAQEPTDYYGHTKTIASPPPTIADLPPSQPTTFLLTPSYPIIRLRTPWLHLTLSHDRPPECVYVHVRWLDAAEATKLEEEGIVRLERGGVRVLGTGEGFFEREFFVWGGKGRRENLVGVRYSRVPVREGVE